MSGLRGEDKSACGTTAVIVVGLCPLPLPSPHPNPGARVRAVETSRALGGVWHVCVVCVCVAILVASFLSVCISPPEFLHCFAFPLPFLSPLHWARDVRSSEGWLLLSRATLCFSLLPSGPPLKPLNISQEIHPLLYLLCPSHPATISLLYSQPEPRLCSPVRLELRLWLPEAGILRAGWQELDPSGSSWRGEGQGRRRGRGTLSR